MLLGKKNMKKCKWIKFFDEYYSYLKKKFFTSSDLDFKKLDELLSAKNFKRSDLKDIKLTISFSEDDLLPNGHKFCTLAEGTFKNLSNAAKIDLSNNKFEELNEKILEGIYYSLFV